MRAILLLTTATLLALSSTACTSTSCTRDPDTSSVPLTADGGTGVVHGDIYYSAPVGGPYAYFPPFRTITFDHQFHTNAYTLQFWLAFSAHGTLAPSAGNMTELRVPDDGGAPPIAKDTVSVYNNTCSDFYLWVVAQKSASAGADAGADADVDADSTAAAGAGP